MSFKPNKQGIYDLGGNVWEWVADWWNPGQTDRVLRGGSWINREDGYMLSSGRDRAPPAGRGNVRGFRIVIETRTAAGKN
jgi:formylglycine-generating enzyme required for sulfatase activity